MDERSDAGPRTGHAPGPARLVVPGVVLTVAAISLGAGVLSRPEAGGGHGPGPDRTDLVPASSRVVPWADLAPTHPRLGGASSTRSAFAAIEATGHLDVTASVHGVARFVVTLRTPAGSTGVALDPCPDYRIGLFGNGPPVKHAWALNCDAVPFHDGAGHAYLPAGRPVRFGMQVQAPDHDVPKLIWRLDDPHHPMGVAGSITLGGPGSS